MPSFHDTIADPGAVLLEYQFAERDGEGEYQKLRYFDPRRAPGDPPYEWPGSASAVRSQLVDAPDGGLIKVETRVWTIRREHIDANDVPHIQPNARAEDDLGSWTINPDESKWGSVFVDIGLKRKPKTTGEDLRANAAI